MCEIVQKMSRAKVFISILTVLILIALSGVSVWAAPGGQEPAEGPPTVHPVASALAEFFATKLGLNYDMIMGYHEDGMGFGVIAQACWMSYALEGDATLLGDILEAKKNHDFSSIELDGETPKNWGQFRKAILGSEKAKKNLGAIMSGRAEDEEVVGSSTELPGKGKDKGGKPDTPPGKVKDKKDKDKGGGPPAELPGKGKDKGNESGGPPAEPPGKDKGGGKVKGK